MDVRSYAFVVARALVTEIKKLRQNAPNGQLQPDGIVGFLYGSQDEVLNLELRTLQFFDLNLFEFSLCLLFFCSGTTLVLFRNYGN